MSSWAIGNRGWLSAIVFGLASLSAVIEFVRTYTSERHEFKRVIAHLLDDCAKNSFNERTKQNRLTVFKVTSGWRCFVWSVLRLPLFSKGSKWRAAMRIKWSGQYLGVYLRPAQVRNRNSVTALRVSDIAAECEGMAGQVYEEGFCLIGDLPLITPKDVRQVRALYALPPSHPVRRYSAATRISDLSLLKSFDNFGRHFIGVAIRKGDGTPWGVLLIDSEEEKCPFPLPTGGGQIRDRLQDYARMIGKIVT